ncbi:MAG: FAD-dependent oxidoreductase, partial [bacterium]|nr:FAD-dependent oxidoreductase [bacterium]
MENKKFDVVIIGAGPAGIFTALKLNDIRPDLKVLIVDMGRDIASRVCPARKTGVCAHCKPCAIVSGWSGAGAFSDGKLSLSDEVGGHLNEYVGHEKAMQLIEEADQYYLKFG